MTGALNQRLKSSLVWLLSATLPDGSMKAGCARREPQIGKAIKELRTEKTVTQEAFAEHLGISFQAVSKWENGSAYPDITLLPALARYFGVSLDQLFDRRSTSGREG